MTLLEDVGELDTRVMEPLPQPRIDAVSVAIGRDLL